MGRFIFGLIFVMTIALTQALSSTFSIFEDHKLKVYSLKKSGVKDVLFDVKMKGLEDYVKKTTAITEFDDLYFRVYWAYPSQYKVRVEGLPKGFRVLRENLKSMVKPYIDLIFSDNFIVQFERLPFVKSPKNKNTYYKKRDELDTTDIRISFNKKGLLSTIKSSTPYSRIETEFKNKVHSWSNGKHVVDKIIIKEKVNGLINKKVISVERLLVTGIGMPKTVILNESLLNGEKVINSSDREFSFFNYHINTGKPQRIMKGIKH